MYFQHIVCDKEIAGQRPKNKNVKLSERNDFKVGVSQTTDFVKLICKAQKVQEC